MDQFFHSWRRKTGLTLLVVALLLAGAWCNSLTETQSIRIYLFGKLHSFQSHLGTLGWVAGPADSFHCNQKAVHVSYRTAGFGPTTEFAVLPDLFWECRWKNDFFVFEKGCHMMKPKKYLDSKSLSIRFEWWRVPYWAVIVPLTLISAHLLCIKSRRTNTCPFLGIDKPLGVGE